MSMVDKLIGTVDRLSSRMGDLMTGFGAITALLGRRETRLDGLEGR